MPLNTKHVFQDAMNAYYAHDSDSMRRVLTRMTNEIDNLRKEVEALRPPPPEPKNEPETPVK